MGWGVVGANKIYGTCLNKKDGEGTAGEFQSVTNPDLGAVK